MPYTSTAEQSRIIEDKSPLLVVLAGAGCGKTSTLELIAQASPQERMLYLVFGKANQEEAKQRFAGTGVVSRTQHAIALARCGLAINHKLADNYRLTDIKNTLKLKDWGMAQLVQDAFNAFLISDYHTIDALPSFSPAVKLHVKTLWDAARDPKNPFPCKPDVYLKHYCLQPPEMHQWFSTILLDEGQDTNPVIADWIMKQKTRIILVGDDNQQLFRFRGAGNFLTTAIHKHKAKALSLTQSFRFGQPIAEVANAILKVKTRILKTPSFTLKGTPSKEATLWDGKPSEWEKRSFAALHRTVAGTLQTALEHPNATLHWLGGFSRYRMQEVLDVYHLSRGENDKIVRKKLLSEARTFSMYQQIADQTKDVEQRRILKLLEKYGSRLPTLLNGLTKRNTQAPEKADIILGTVHAAKGLEFERVLLADDFKKTEDLLISRDDDEISDELNILYVAATRATGSLSCNAALLSILQRDPVTSGLIRETSSQPNSVNMISTPLTDPRATKKATRLNVAESERTWTVTPLRE